MVKHNNLKECHLVQKQSIAISQISAKSIATGPSHTYTIITVTIYKYCHPQDKPNKSAYKSHTGILIAAVEPRLLGVALFRQHLARFQHELLVCYHPAFCEDGLDGIAERTVGHTLRCGRVSRRLVGLAPTDLRHRCLAPSPSSRHTPLGHCAHFVSWLGRTLLPCHQAWLSGIPVPGRP